MLTGILFVVTALSAATCALLGRQALKYKKEFLVYKSENNQLHSRLYEAVAGEITDIDIDAFLKHNNMLHEWNHKANAKKSWLTSSDTLRTDVCRRCGLMRRYWVFGFGPSSYEGIFRNGIQIYIDANQEPCYNPQLLEVNRKLIADTQTPLLGPATNTS